MSYFVRTMFRSLCKCVLNIHLMLSSHFSSYVSSSQNNCFGVGGGAFESLQPNCLKIIVDNAIEDNLGSKGFSVNNSESLSFTVLKCFFNYAKVVLNKKESSGRHSSVVSSAPTILRLQVRIPSTPSTLYSISII